MDCEQTVNVINSPEKIQEQYEKKQKRKEQAKIYSYNMKSYNKKNFQKQGEDFLTSYFINLTNINELIKKYYFGKSILSLSKYENISESNEIKKNVQNITVQGIEDIFNNLILIKEFNNYVYDEYIIQPTLGQGVFISVRGILNVNFKFTINFNLILIKNEFYILNQYINIDCT